MDLPCRIDPRLHAVCRRVDDAITTGGTAWCICRIDVLTEI
jgi:hypothetical protein